MKKLLLVFVFLLTHNLIFSQDVLMQNGTFNVTTGTFYDSGGASSNYANDEDYTITICPENAGEFIVLDFSSFAFSTGANTDILTIYEGDDTSGTVIETTSGGGASGNPGVISASPTSPTGCLTITFSSDDAGNGSGWGATISTMQSCQTITPTIDSTNPVANTSGVIQIPVGTTVTFNGSATFSDDGTGATYSWNFGDGSSIANGASTTHTYNNLGGPYTVTFTVTDANPTGCSESVTITVEMLSPYIDVDQTTYTIEELVTDVLIDSPCAAVSNIASSTGINYNSTYPNGIGYFSTNGGVFPFESGIILTTGSAVAAEGPETGNQSAQGFNWDGDSDLEAIIPGLTNSNDATYIQFDFVPLSSTISFDFLFASEEYGQYQCGYTDAFAFILTDQITGTVTNLAIVPGTTDVVSVFTVRDNAYNALCSSVNPNFFDAYYGGGGSDSNISPTNFLGHTTAMTAFSNVIPNNPYNIKLVIADALDHAFDAGVFLGAGSFNLGGDLGDDVTIEAGTAKCIGEEIILDTNMVQSVDPDDPSGETLIPTFTWTFNGVTILDPNDSTSNLNTPSLTINGQDYFNNNEPYNEALFEVSVYFSDDCQSSDDVNITYKHTPIIQGTSDVFRCNVNPIFDLTENDIVILGANQDADLFSITYHNSENDASNGVSAITNPATYTGINDEIIYVRIEDVQTETCPDYTLNDENEDSADDIPASFKLFLIDNPTVTVSSNTPVCSGEDAVFTITGTANNEVNYNINNGVTEQVILDASGVATVTVIGATVDQTLTVTSIIDSNAGCTNNTETFSETIEVNSQDDPSFTMTSTCNGVTVEVTGTTGGTFTFETAPTDDAEIDANTGTITDGTPNATYTVVYTTSGDCPNSSNQDVTLLDADDSSFAMTPTCDGGTVTTQPIASGGQYSFDASSPAGNTGAINDSNTGEVTGASPGEQYVISYTSAGTCPTTSTFDLEVYSLPVVVDPTPLEVCDDGTPDGIVEMDLTVKDDEITGANPSYTVTYYEQVDANGDPVPSSEITTPEAYTNTVPNMQTLYVLVTDENTTCSDTTTLQLEVEQAPATTTPDALEYCDPDSDGFGVFTLTDANAQITGGASGLIVTYHETMIDAENNLNALSSPYNNIVVNTQTIYVRVESETIATDCASFEELVLIVHPTPAIADPTPLEICDDETADGFATFDLTTKDTEILNGLDPTLYTVIYYLEEADAEVPQNAIASPNAYTNTTAYNQTVWVRVEDNTTGCYKVTSLELVVNALPVLEQPDPLTLCDYNNPGDEIEEFTLEDANAQILNGQTGITLTYYDTEENAETGDGTGQLFSPYVNGPNPEAIYVRGENDVTGCWSIVILDLRVAPLPSPATPADYEVCDDDNDGFAEFDLESQSDAIENGEPDITITYHETEVDANSGENPLPDNYTNIVVNTQTVYVRAEHTGATPAEATGCFTIVELTLIVLPAPVIPVTLPDYVICDEDTDGYAQFDFDTVMDPQIYGSQDPADFILSYHTTLAAAESGNNPIINTSNYTNGMQWAEDIYIHLESIANGCITTRMFTIRVVTAPEVNPNYDHILTSCDDLDENYQEINDGFTSFNLTSEDLEITDGEASWIVTYYETQADAEAGINAIDPATDYTNIDQGVQTIVAEVTDTDTGCSSFTTVTLQVLPNPSPSPDPENLELCDDNNSGDMMETFDLTENEGYILNNEDGVTLSYYTSQEDAVMGTNAIADATQHSNEDPDNLGTGITPQTIYVRAENTGTPDVPATGCYSLVTFDVIVNPLPVVPDSIEGLLYCEIDNDGTYDDFGFDLESQTEIILNGQDPMIYTVTYHIDQADADAGENALISPYENIQNPQIIYVNVTNTETDCTISTLNFTIEVQEGALANQNLEPYEICDDNMEFDGDTTNDMAEFDLSTQNALALDGQDPNNYTVTYYASQEDADAFTNPLPILYTNAVNPQTIIVRVDNDTPGPIIGLDLSLVDAPGLDFNNDGTMDTYDTDNDNIFDFINVNVDDNDDNVSDGYDYDSDGLIDAIDIDDDNIGDLVYINGEIVNDTSMCYETAELVLQVNPMPSFDLEDSYLLCVNTNGTEVVNVPLIDTGLDVTNYSFEWSLNDVVIPGETGPSITPTQGGKYSVVVTDVNTGCSTNPTDPNTITQVNESQPPTIVAEQTTLAFADQHNISVQVTNITPDNIGIYEFSIDGSEWSSNTPNDAMYLFENVEAGDHIIKARDINGCGETAINITIMDYPHYFTPNGDSYNDTWNIYGLSNQLDAKIYIFDRFGKLIKQISPAGEGWDGTYRGNLMPTNDYWFTVEYREPNATIEDAKKTFKAHFTLKR